MKPLDLNSEITASIKVDDKEFIIPDDIPIDVIIMGEEIQNKKDLKAIAQACKDYLFEVLKVKNKPDEVEHFIDTLGYNKLLKVINYINEFYAEINKSEPLKKKETT